MSISIDGVVKFKLFKREFEARELGDVYIFDGSNVMTVFNKNQADKLFFEKWFTEQQSIFLSELFDDFTVSTEQ